MNSKINDDNEACPRIRHWRQRQWARRGTPLFNSILLLFGCALLFTWNNNYSVVSAGSVDSKSGVIALTAKNFDSSLRNGNVWLVEFYAPWCGHCVRFASTYELVANQLHSDHEKSSVTRKVSVSKIDGAAERALSSRFGVHGFPTFYLVDGWTVREYKGNRSHEALIAFALNDYDKTEPVPFITGPFGPMGQLRSLLMRSGAWVVGMYENLTLSRGMKPLIAMSVLCVGGLTVGLVLITLLGILFLSKAKAD